MLKIKDGVDLKDLEKVFEDNGHCYERYLGWGWRMYVDKETRQIKVYHPYALRQEPTQDEIKDIIKLVEAQNGSVGD